MIRRVSRARSTALPSARASSSSSSSSAGVYVDNDEMVFGAEKPRMGSRRGAGLPGKQLRQASKGGKGGAGGVASRSRRALGDISNNRQGGSSDALGGADGKKKSKVSSGMFGKSRASRPKLTRRHTTAGVSAPPAAAMASNAGAAEKNPFERRAYKRVQMHHSNNAPVLDNPDLLHSAFADGTKRQLKKQRGAQQSGSSNNNNKRGSKKASRKRNTDEDEHDDDDEDEADDEDVQMADARTRRSRVPPSLIAPRGRSRNVVEAPTATSMEVDTPEPIARRRARHGKADARLAKTSASSKMEEETEEDDTEEEEEEDDEEEETFADDEAKKAREEARLDAMYDVDSGDGHDTQLCSEYAVDIFKYLKKMEGRRAVPPTYMSKQADLSPKMREILVDWLCEVALKFRLRHETLYLTVNLIDRFLLARQVQRRCLQLVGVTAMLIASKYEEIYAPEVRDFVYICDNAYDRDQILNMEAIMLQTLEFNLTVPSALRFAQRFNKVAASTPKLAAMSLYLVELTLQRVDMLKFLPSMVASAAVYLARRLDGAAKETEGDDDEGEGEVCEGYRAWTPKLAHHTWFGESDLEACAKELYRLYKRAPGSNFKAVVKKFSSAKFCRVAREEVKQIAL